MATLEQITTVMSAMEERLAQRLEERIRVFQVDVNGQFDAMNKRLERLEQEYQMLRVGLARLEADVGTLKLDVAALKSDVSELKLVVTHLDTEAAQDRADRKDLLEQALEFRRRLDDLEGRVQEIEGRLPPE